MATLSFESARRMEMLLSQVRAEFSGQQQQRHDDWQRHFNIQVAELHSIRQTLDSLEKKHKAETTEYQVKLRSHEETINSLKAQLALKSSETPAHEKKSAMADKSNNMISADALVNWADLPLESVPTQYKDAGSDWYAIYNPHLPRQLNIALRYTLGHDSVVCCVRFSPDGQNLATASHQTIQVFDVETGALVASLQEHHNTAEESFIRSLCFSPDGRYLATASEDKLIRLWDICQQKIDKVLAEHTEEIYSVEYAADGRSLVSCSRDGSVKLWDIQQGKSSLTLIAQDSISCVSVSPDMKYIVGSCHDATICVWSLRTGNVVTVLHTPEGHVDSAYCLSHLPTCGAGFASGSLDRTVKIWRPRPQIGVHSLSKEPSVSQFWDATTLQGHKDFVVSISATPDARWIMSGSKDRTCRLWDVQTGELQGVLHGHSNTVLSVAASRQCFATGGGDKAVRLWSYTPSDAS